MNRIKFIDTLKFVAIFSIILLHVSAIWDSTGILDITFKNFREIFRFGVPLFLMITGTLMLNKEIDLEIFLKKKFVRLVYPLVFFFIISYVLNVYTDFLKVYWYCWMAIGVYLTIPIINVFIKYTEQKELNYLVILIFITSIIYTVVQMFGIKLALDLDFFIGPTAYLIIGYYFSKNDFVFSSNKIILASILIFIVSSIFKIYCFDGLFWNGNSLLISQLDLSFFQILQSLSVLIFFKYLYKCSSGLFGAIRQILESNIINNIIVSISRSSYGIYLVHMILYVGYVKPFFENIHMTGTDTLIYILILAPLFLMVSWLIILILSRIPVVNKVSGYH